ncbi:MAG: hypothetical protein F4X18_11715 [Acidimicrobiia bacterium]|nr:hypothetical protein [Acidimicrobiia bacterium]
MTAASTRPTPVGEAGLEKVSGDARSLVDSWLSAVSESGGAWPGYDLADIPTVLVSVDAGGRVEAVVAFNHPNPNALGSAILSVDVDGHSVGVVGEPADPERLVSMAPFDFFADIGGTETFVLVGQRGEPGREPDTPGFVAMIAHEGFHRYQFDNWVPGAAVQDVEGYDFGAENIELVLLENRVLVAAYQADATSDLERLARQFAAVRAVRHARDPRVALDEQQERMEGSARWIEHRMGDAIGNTYTSTNHTSELGYLDQSIDDPGAVLGNVKSFFGFGRFYSSGATVLALLERLGVAGADVAGRLGDGGTPAQLLEQRIAPLGDRDDLVAAAWAEHDPDGRLGAAAAALAERAAAEGETDFGAGDVPEETLGPGFEAGDDQIACLQEHGLDLSADSVTIPDDIAAACFGGPES